MGQQQLLLLVLSTVIVGLATVAGIQAFSQNQIQANGDALSSTGLAIASDIQAWAQKPEQLGGGGIDLTSSVSTAPEFSEIGYETGNANGASSSQYGTNAGIFSIETSVPSACSFDTTPNLVVHGRNNNNNNYGNDICVGISGNSSSDIVTDLNLGS